MRRRLRVVLGALCVTAASIGLQSRQAPPTRPAAQADDPANAAADFSTQPPVRPLPPAEQAKRFWLPPGYRMAPVLADPDIDNPVQVAFDGSGRMFVVEMRGYTQTRDGMDALEPVGRISIHEDRDRDGAYEIHHVFVDKLLLPRLVMPMSRGTALVLENNGDELWQYDDVNGDGVADRRTVFMTGFGRGGALGGQPSGLVWAMDNWIYSAVNAFRVRWTPNGVVREPTGPNGAQWGATQDNDGKMWFQAGASGLPGYFQFPVAHGAFTVPDQFEPDLNITWGAPILIADMSGGLPTTRMPDGSLKYVTAGAGNDIYRGDRLPRDLVGDYLYGEIVARIVRRLRPVVTEGLTQLRNVYPRSEFIRSLDPLFRPVDMATAPDGTLYVVDMYRGVVEWAPGAKVGTYLRNRIDQYQLDQVSSHGRIFRLTYDGMPRDRTVPRLYDETSASLVARLAHPNGWWRDTAQQQLVLRQDRSIVPALVRMTRDRTAAIEARSHALWTLEGLGALPAGLVREAMEDASSRLRRHAIRASETLYKAGDRSWADDYRRLAADADPDVAIQALLTLNTLKVPEAATTITASRDAHRGRGVTLVADALLKMPLDAAPAGLAAEQRSAFERGGVIYRELCFACHGTDGRGASQPPGGGTMAPSLAGSPRVNGHRDYVVRAILDGLTGPIDGRVYAESMVPMGTNTDRWVADVASFVRKSFGNSASWVTPADVARARAARHEPPGPWTVGALTSSLPVPMAADAAWKVTASHASPTAGEALTLGGWTTGAAQQTGMWFEVELPQPIALTEIEFTSPTQGGGRNGPPPVSTFPRGLRVDVSTDGATWTSVAPDAVASPGVTTIAFSPVQARWVKLSLTTTPENGPPWSMQRLRIYQGKTPGAR